MGSPRSAAEKLLSEANGFMATREHPKAEACLREAIRLAPEFAEAHANLGLLLNITDRRDEAEACYRRALVLNPASGQIHLNHGTLLDRLGRFDEAETAYRRALDRNPVSAAAWSNLGALYVHMQRFDDAERCCRRSISIDQRYGNARFNLAYLCLRQCRFEEGWAHFEARDWYAPLQAHLECPRWNGEPLAGKSLLIGYEAGHGDMIQFCRYVPVLKRQGAARIDMICHPALTTLFADLEGLDNVRSFAEPIARSGWDLWTPLMSIPFHSKTRIDTIPAELPYLRVDDSAVARWREQVPARGLRVGLVWKGNPNFENDDQRSLGSLDQLAPLGSVPGVRFVSLQKGAGEDEALNPPPGLSLVHVGDRIEDFSDTAAVIQNLDLVICVDTAAAHLAGALGKPCWLLLPRFMTDWRWTTDRADSPWYPGVVRIFRQRSVGDWAAVIQDVRTALAEVAGDPGQCPDLSST